MARVSSQSSLSSLSSFSMGSIGGPGCSSGTRRCDTSDYHEAKDEPHPNGVPLAVIPLMAEDTPVGVIAVYRRLPHNNGFNDFRPQLGPALSSSGRGVLLLWCEGVFRSRSRLTQPWEPSCRLPASVPGRATPRVTPLYQLLEAHYDTAARYLDCGRFDRASPASSLGFSRF